ncbi:MAG: sulfite exporter TauE/SafE family protein [Ferruginibacter sp.]
MSYLLFISALVLGFGGSLHCVGMCGPLVVGMPFHRVNNKPFAILLYMLAKALAYASLGVLIGIIGKGFAVLAMQQALSFTAGLFIIIFALLPHLLRKIKMPSLLSKRMAASYSKVLEKPSLNHFFAFGFFNGLLPCGLVYAALAAASVTASPWGGGFYMFLFGIGNSPALIAAILLKNKGSLVFRKYLSKFSLVIVLATGLLLMLRSFEGVHTHSGVGHAGRPADCLPTK